MQNDDNDGQADSVTNGNDTEADPDSKDEDINYSKIARVDEEVSEMANAPDTEVVDAIGDSMMAGTENSKMADNEDSKMADTEDSKMADTKDSKMADTKDSKMADHVSMSPEDGVPDMPPLEDESSDDDLFRWPISRFFFVLKYWSKQIECLNIVRTYQYINQFFLSQLSSKPPPASGISKNTNFDDLFGSSSDDDLFKNWGNVFKKQCFLI